MARNVFRTGFIAASLTLGLASTVNAGVSDPQILLSKPLYGAGESADITLTGEPGHVPVLLVASLPGDVDIPGVGTLGVSFAPLPTMVVLPPFNPSGEASVNCTFDCESPILREPCFLQVVTIHPGTGSPSGISNVGVLNVVGEDCGECPAAADIDPNCGGGSLHAITLPGIGNDYVFVSGGSIVETTAGEGLLSGIVARQSNPGERFFAEIHFSNRVNAGDANFPPVGSPKLELCAAAYGENGGPVRPEVWHYYESLSGHLWGLEDFDGAVLQLDRAGPALQVGKGANGKNLEYGASSWLTVQVLSHPDSGAFPNPPSGGDININFDGDCTDCPSAAEKSNGSGHALWLPAIGTDFLFDDGALFEERNDGTAHLTGRAYRKNDHDIVFDVDVVFAGRIDPGTEKYAPAGSPKEELDPSAYSENGGPIDTSLWRYYETTTGTLLGREDLEGAMYSIERRGPAFQVGLGASGKNFEFGGAGWIDVTLHSQPNFGPSLPQTGDGDFNLDIGDCE